MAKVMKIAVWKAPKFLSPLLRRIFKLKGK